MFCTIIISIRYFQGRKCKMLNQKLYTLLAVSETKNITQAAEKLNLTQPAVSQHIKALEQEFSTKIFNRTDSGLKITEDGKLIVKFAKRADALYQALVEDLKDSKKRVKHFTIGVTQSAEMGMIAEILATLCAEKKGTNITLISDTIINLYSKLKNYMIDFAIIDGRMQNPGFNSVLLATDNLMLVVSNKHPFAKKSIVTLDELKKENLILRPSTSGTRQLFESHLKSNNESIDNFNILMEIDSVNTIKGLVKHGFGVSILAKSLLTSDIAKGKLKAVPIANLSMIREINIIYPKSFDSMEILNDITRLYLEQTQKQPHENYIYN